MTSLKLKIFYCINVSSVTRLRLVRYFLLPHFDVLCDLLLNRSTVTWNLFVEQKMELRYWWIMMFVIYYKEIISHGGWIFQCDRRHLESSQRELIRFPCQAQMKEVL